MSSLAQGSSVVLERCYERVAIRWAGLSTVLSSVGLRSNQGEPSGEAVVEAYVLIQTEIGKPPQVAAELGRISGVGAADILTGPYDVIVRVEAADVDALGKLVVTKIQAVEGVTRTLTCPVVHL